MSTARYKHSSILFNVQCNMYKWTLLDVNTARYYLMFNAIMWCINKHCSIMNTCKFDHYANVFLNSLLLHTLYFYLHIIIRRTLLDKLKFFIWYQLYILQTSNGHKLLIYFLLLLLAYNYSWILINSHPCLALVHSCMASCRPGLQLVAWVASLPSAHEAVSYRSPFTPYCVHCIM